MIADLSADIRRMREEMERDVRFHVGTGRLAEWERRAEALEAIVEFTASCGGNYADLVRAGQKAQAALAQVRR